MRYAFHLRRQCYIFVDSVTEWTQQILRSVYYVSHFVYTNFGCTNSDFIKTSLMCLFVTDVRYGSKEILPIVAILSSPGNPKWPFQIVYLVVRFTRAKYYTSCGPLCRPTPACTYCTNESSVHLVTSIISPNLNQALLYLTHTLPSICALWKLFQYFFRRISWFFGNFLQRHPPQFPSFSHVAILRAFVRP